MNFMRSSQILVIDDEKDFRDMLRDLLSKNFTVVEAMDGHEGLRLAKASPPSLILIDMQMAGIDGIEVCKRIRQEPALKTIPIIMISGTANEASRTESFLWGADDFIAKPFSGRELLARIMSKLSWTRQPVSKSSAQVNIGNLILDFDRLEAKVNEQVVDLTQFEMKLLHYFVSNQDKVLSREQILTDIWRECQVTSRTVDTHVYYLRKKMSDFNYEFTTVHGAGYRLKPKPHLS